MATEREGAFTFGPVTYSVYGEQLSPGDQAPDFRLLANDFREKTLADFSGSVRLISAVPSLETRVCDMQTRRFNEEAAALGDDIVILTVSADLPFTQKRWCGAAGVERVHTLSDHRDMNFGDAYGTHVKGLRLEQRAVFVVDASDTVRYVEYLPAGGHQPDYEKVLEAARAAVA